MHYQHILGATDFSELGDLALRRAAELAAAAGSSLTALTVLPQPEIPSPLISHYDVHVGKEQRERALAAARDALEARIPEEIRAAGLPIRYEVRIGDPTDEILLADAELEPELIVLATHGRRGWQRFIMGSVAERVVQFARADVLAVRARPASA